MPRTLSFNESHLDARILRRGVVARLRTFPEVFSVERHVGGGEPEGHILYRVTLRIEAESDFLDTAEPTNPALRRLLQEFAYWPENSFEPYREPPPREVRSLSEVLSQDARDQIITQALATSEGRSRLAQAMVAPLRARRDYQSIGRRTLLVEQLPEGALPIYDRDPEVGQMAVSHGWDGNGSPLAAPPAWVQPGQWAYNARLDQYLVILEKEPKSSNLYGFKAEIWRSPEPARWFDVDYIYENWKPCDPPADPLSQWDRLLGDDAL
jgi:hypothetical protein